MKKIILLGIILLSSCGSNTNYANIIRAEGDIISKEVTLEQFNNISVSGFSNITFRASEEYSIIIEMAENIFDFFSSDNLVSNGTLNLEGISPGPGYGIEFGQYGGPKIYIYAPPYLQSLSASGSANIYFYDYIYSDRFNLDISGFADVNISLEVGHFEINTSGSSDINIRGSADTANISASGFSNIYAGYFYISEADITASGSSNIYIYVAETLVSSRKNFSRITNLADGSVLE